mmetsp:Transcript_24725/g.71391  ORF Transcript_24725/g.71391 Transcript_24725/m.71391 type:complete len:350 (-) Transcript_24725:163-1212(-)
MYAEFGWNTSAYGDQTNKGSKPHPHEGGADGVEAKGIAELPALHYREHLAKDLYYSMPITSVLFNGRSKFQSVQIFSTKHFGKVLVLDNKMQSAQSDECLYHESLVHPALLSHPHPEAVFIGGGGEGATLREVLRHKNVKRVVMVDIDQIAVKMCRDNLPEWNGGVYDDPRVEVIYDDAGKYLATSGERFDVVIMDISDPIEAGPGWVLYTKEFYQKLKRDSLREHGVLCTQSTACSVNMITEGFTVINQTLKKVFAHVCPYRIDIPSFGAPWGFHICSDNAEFLLSPDTPPGEIDELLEARLGADQIVKLKHYEGYAHRHMFSLSKYERLACEREKRLLSTDNPVFVE